MKPTILLPFVLAIVFSACDGSGSPSPEDGQECLSSDGQTTCVGCPDESEAVAGGSCGVAGKECKYLRRYCPEHPLGSSYFYENTLYRCDDGHWQSQGQDCYDCCRLPLGRSP